MRFPIYGLATAAILIAIAAVISSMVPFLFMAMATLP